MVHIKDDDQTYISLVNLQKFCSVYAYKLFYMYDIKVLTPDSHSTLKLLTDLIEKIAEVGDGVR